MINVIVDINNAGSIYNGHLHVYIIEKTSRWITYDGGNFKNALLDFAINKDVTVNAGGLKTETATWNGAANGFGDIVQSNILVVAAVFSQQTGYTDETASTNPTTGSNYNPPYEPSSPSPEDGATNVNTNTQLS